MAWTHPTAEGYMFGSPSKLRVMLFEICRAINQREALWSGAAFTLFRNASNTEVKTFPTMDDLYHMPLWGQGSENIMRRNMQTINQWIRAYSNTNPGIFFQSGDFGSPRWTLAELQTAIGYEFPSLYPEKLTDAAWWQGVIDALNLMIYIRKTPFLSATIAPLQPSVVSRTVYFKGYANGIEEVDGTDDDYYGDAWDSMYLASEQTASHIFLVNMRTQVSCGYWTLGTPKYVATSVRKVQITYDLSLLPGVCLWVDANLDCRDNDSENETYTGGPWTVKLTIGSAEHEIELTDTEGTYSYEIDPGEFDYEAHGTFSIERTSPSVPADPPFDGAYMEDAIAGYVVQTNPIFHLDLSSELDDQ